MLLLEMQIMFQVVCPFQKRHFTVIDYFNLNSTESKKVTILTLWAVPNGIFARNVLFEEDCFRKSKTTHLRGRCFRILNVK